MDESEFSGFVGSEVVPYVARDRFESKPYTSLSSTVSCDEYLVAIDNEWSHHAVLLDRCHEVFDLLLGVVFVVFLVNDELERVDELCVEFYPDNFLCFLSRHKTVGLCVMRLFYANCPKIQIKPSLRRVLFFVGTFRWQSPTLCIILKLGAFTSSEPCLLPQTLKLSQQGPLCGVVQ